MTDIPFPVTSSPGGQIGGGRLVNCFAAEIEGAPASRVQWTRSAGSDRVLLIGDAAEGVIGARGFIMIAQTLMHFPAGQCYSVTQLSNGSLTYELRGVLEGTQPLTLAQNFKTPTPDTVVVTENGGFIITTTGAPSSWSLPAVPNSVTQTNGFFVLSTSGGTLYTSEQNSTTVNPSSNVPLPEKNLSRTVEYNGYIYAFGNNFFRVYRNTAAVAAGPFYLEYQEVKRDYGIAGTWAIAGFEQGFPGQMIFAGADNVVYRMEGFTPQRVSTDAVQTAIEKAGEDKANMVASVYSEGGQSFWVLTLPGVFTWEYNYTTGTWNERESYQTADWRGRASIKAFDQWIVGDRDAADLYSLIGGWPVEFNAVLPSTIESGILQDSPNRLNATRTYLKFEAGVGLDRGTVPQIDPKVEVFISRTGGTQFAEPIERPLGKEGDYNQEVVIANSGPSNSKGLQYRIQVTDAVDMVFMGATADLEVLAP